MPRPVLSSGSSPADRSASTPHATSGVAATLRSLGVRPSRRLGQNFLCDPRVAERIASLVSDPMEPVLEIGPGLGALTTLLARTGRPLVAVEVDFRLAEALERTLEPWAEARVIRGDILAQVVSDLVPGDEPLTVVGNLPYSITTPAIEWILAQGPRVRRAVLMAQREYAERLAAKPGGKEYGSLTVFVSLHAKVATLFRASPGAFYPRPDVDSVVLEMMPRPFPGTTEEERVLAERLARAGMGTRRKTIANSLARGMETDAPGVRTLLNIAGIEAERRAETLGVEEWVRLARVWRDEALRT
jgi:16S rRNA (adenine1518-N6/adenine1519-N6)-dimethyltransferase